MNPTLPDTEALGSTQSPLIVKSALDQAFASLRGENSWLLPYIFKGVAYDLPTNGLYGQAWIDQAIKWVKNTDIPVLWNISLEGSPPCVTLALLNSTQSNETLSDQHYIPREDFAFPPTVLAGPFTPTYTVATGTFVVPQAIGDALYITPVSMAIQTANGTQYPILDVLDPYTFEIADGIVDNFVGASIVQPSPNGVLHLESVRFKETMAINLHVIGDPVELIYLTSIVEAILMFFKESLLEARGLAISSFSMSDFGKDFAGMESRFNRSFTLEFIRELRYPKFRFRKITGISPKFLVEDGGATFEKDTSQLLVTTDGIDDGDMEP